MNKFIQDLKVKYFSKGKFRTSIFAFLGKIAMLMLSILLALQVDTWNAKRVASNTHQEYLVRLQVEVNAEIQYFTTVRTKFVEKEEKLRRILTRWQTEDFVITDSLEYINDFTGAGAIGPWYNEPIIWTQLVQSGNLSEFNNQALIEDLFKYYSSVKSQGENYMGNPMNQVNEIRQRLTDPFINEPHADYFNEFFQLKVAPSKNVFELIKTDKKGYQLLFLRMAFSCHRSMETMTELIDSGKNLVELLETETTSDE